MKRQLFILTILACLTLSLFGQTYTGTSADKYHCNMTISNGGKVATFKYNLDDNVVYAEYWGKIKKVKDSLYHISATMHVGQFFMKSFRTDTLYIQMDTSNLDAYGNITVKYSNGQEANLKTWNNGKKVSLIKFGFDKKLFNEKNGSNYISLKYKKCAECFFSYLNCKIPYGSSASFEAGEKIEFDIIIYKDKLWTVGIAPLQTGHFKLTKKK